VLRKAAAAQARRCKRATRLHLAFSPRVSMRNRINPSTSPFGTHSLDLSESCAPPRIPGSSAGPREKIGIPYQGPYQAVEQNGITGLEKGRWAVERL
jgi:hypothetical protein